MTDTDDSDDPDDQYRIDIQPVDITYRVSVTNPSGFEREYVTEQVVIDGYGHLDADHGFSLTSDISPSVLVPVGQEDRDVISRVNIMYDDDDYETDTDHAAEELLDEM